MSIVPNRDQAYALLARYNVNDGLIRHALAVEAVMRYYARKYGEDEEKWGIIGLVHDLDYEQYPSEHCGKSAEILRENQWPEDYIRAVMSHGWGMYTNIEPQSIMEKVLYTIDELTGLITATVLVRPSKSIMDLAAKSVKKKWKDKSFSAGVDRSVIEKGALMLGVELTDIITDTIEGMKCVAGELGLAGV